MNENLAEADDSRSCVLLTEMGDVEISWDSQHDDEMREIIAKKMAEGVRFFVIKPVIGNFFHRRTALKSIHDLDRNRIQIKDEDIEKMFVAGKIAMFRGNGSGQIDTTGVAETADDAVKTHTVAVKPFVGG